MRRLGLVLMMQILTGCAVLHHVQIGEIDNRNGYRRKKIDVKVSETGINIDEAASVAKSLGGRREGEAVEQVRAIVQLFQYGPRTGNPVYVENFARTIGDEIWKACPSGHVTGLTSIREMRKYPVISGEIVKITGYCLKKQ